MKAKENSGGSGYLRLLPLISAYVVIVIALLVLAGWIFDIVVFKSVRPDYVSMKANTAMGFIFGGMALWSLAKQNEGRWFLLYSRIFSSLLLFLVIITLVQYVLGMDVGIDNILFADDPHAPGTYTPGRMAYETSIAFIITGVSLILAGRDKISCVVVSQISAFFIFIAGVLPLSGYVFGAEAFYGYGDYTHVALHTAVAFMIFSLGIMTIKPRSGLLSVLTGSGTGSYVARRILPVIVLTPIVLVWLWLITYRMGWEWLSGDISVFFTIMLAVMVIITWRIADSINRLETERKESDSRALEYYEMLEFIIRHAPSAIAVHDRDMRYLFVSDLYMKSYKVEQEDIIGKHHYDVFPDLPEKWRKVHKRVLKGEVISAEDDKYERADGSVEYTRWQCMPWKNHAGEIGGLVVYTEIITERRKAEREHLETARRFQMVMDHTGDGIIAVDKEGRATLVNRACSEMLGFSKEELIGNKIHKMHHHTRKDGTEYPEDECAVLMAIKTGRIHYIRDEVFWRKEGSNFPVEYMSSPLYENGELSGAVVSFRDVSKRKEAEDKVTLLNRRLYQLISVIQQLSSAKDIGSIRKEILNAARELSGAEGATFIEYSKGNCHYVEESAINPLWKGGVFPAGDCISGWVMNNREMAYVYDVAEDDRIPYELYKDTFVKSLLVLPVNLANPVAAIGVYWARHYKPLPEEVELLESLASATLLAMERIELLSELEKRVALRTEQLEAANKELEAFSYSVSHDLRAPLRAIDGFTRILLEDHLESMDQEGRRVCNVIRDNTVKMNRLITDLLAFSRLSRKEIQFEKIDMQKLVHSIYHEVCSKEDMERIDFSAGGLCEAVGDASMIRQVWTNLISNAVKFSSGSDNPRIRLSCSMKDGVCSYNIEDNGVGFDMKYVDRIFDVFQRLHSEREFKGTGVGLAIVHRVVTRHGGELRAWGEPGKDACFSFNLPYKGQKARDTDI